MKEDQDYIQDIAEMRAMMERSSKFLSLSGLAGVMAGIYALAGAFIAYQVFDFNPTGPFYYPGRPATGNVWNDLLPVIFLATSVLLLAIGTAYFLSSKKAVKRRETFWNATTRQLLFHMAVPLVAGGLLILLLIAQGITGFIAPFTLLFYGLSLCSASKFTYEEVKSLGLINVGLGLLSSYFVEYGLICWAAGFGVVHIIYGIYMHYRYER